MDAKSVHKPNITRLNPAALSPEELAKLLSAAGGIVVTVDQIRADLEDGAPVSEGGRINLVHYGAWLVKRMAEDRGTQE